MEDNLCLVCFTSDFRYDEEHFRNICNVCNTMQEVTGIGVTTYENDQNINFSRLKTIKINKKRKLNVTERKKIKLQNAVPWNLHELFKWIFDKQVESMKPYVADWNEFHQISEKLWEMYSNTTGRNFDILNESIDNIKMKKYPIGWGTQYDPKTGINLLAKAGKEFSKYKHGLVGSGSGDSDIDYDKVDRNAKKVRVERMVHMKKLEKEELIKDPENKNIRKEEREIREEIDVKDEEENEELKDEKIELKVNEIFNNDGCGGGGEWSLSSSQDSSESALSDEDDPLYVQLDYMDEKEKNKVRTLRKKKEHEVMWKGSYNTQASRLMENNVALLFLTLYYSTKSIECLCLMDILKLIRNKVIPYIRIRRFIPNDLFCINDNSYHCYVLRDHAPSWNYMIVAFNKLMRTLKLSFLIKFDMDLLIRRMLRDLNLPIQFGAIIDLIRQDTHEIDEANIGALKNSDLIRTNYRTMGRKYPYTLFPEPFCLAHIFFVLKIVLKFDREYECKISDLVKKLERSGTIEQGKWFDWLDWWEEMFKAPSFSNSNTWEDLEKVGDAISFLEGRDLEDNYTKFAELGLDWNEDLNHRGRQVGKKKSSHQDVLDAIEKPFRGIFNTLKDLFTSEKKIILLKDFTDSDIRYLIDPKSVQQSLFPDSERTPFSQERDGDGDAYLVMEDLLDIVSKHNFKYQRISYVEPDLNDNIFDQNYTSNTNEIENDLLRILTYDTGITSKNVLHFVFTLERNRLDKKRTKPKRRKRRN